jgi:hypothetical protein
MGKGDPGERNHLRKMPQYFLIIMNT